MVKNLPTNAEDAGLIPDMEDLLEEGMVTHSSIIDWIIPMDRETWLAKVHGVAKSQT